MAHIALIGDSIFDNARYVPGGPSVIDHVKRGLPAGWAATLLAIDGAVTTDVAEQLPKRPAGATHFALSVGGNDALAHAGMIRFAAAASFAEVLTTMARIRDDFQGRYRTLLAEVRAVGLPVVACTVYDCVPGLEPYERAGLALFNEAILAEAFRAGLDVIDLRLVCREASDYSSVSAIEPSDSGGGKITRAVLRAVEAADAGGGESRVFVA